MQNTFRKAGKHMNIKNLFGSKKEMRIAPAPLFKCPVGDAPANPRVIWNRAEKCWFMFFQQRDKNSVLQDYFNATSFTFGSDIGIASSKDNGQTWVYRGIAEGLQFEPGRNTWEMPEVIYNGDEGLYHLFCGYYQGFPAVEEFVDAGPIQILHYTSEDLWHWKLYGNIDNRDENGVNGLCYPSAFRMPNGRWRLFLMNYTGSLHYMESSDMYQWSKPVKIMDGGTVAQTNPNVFRLGGCYWMMTDSSFGYSVYRSNDCEKWTLQDGGMLFGLQSVSPDMMHSGTGSVSQRMDDNAFPHNAGVVVFDDHAYLFYYTHPERPVGLSPAYDKRVVERLHSTPHLRRSVIQVAELTVKDDRLYGKRDEPFDFYLPDMG